MVNDRGYGSGQPQLDIETKGYEFRYRYNLTSDFRERVCTCEHIKYVTGKWRCGNCGLVPVHYLYKCIDCGEIFIKDFSFPWFCSVCPTCYDCSKDIAAPCLLHGIIPLWRETYSIENGAPLGEPLGLNPREITDEERAAIEADFAF